MFLFSKSKTTLEAQDISLVVFKCFFETKDASLVVLKITTLKNTDLLNIDMTFMQTTTMFYQGEPFPEALLGLIVAFMFIFVVLLVAYYVYSSFAYMALARKTKYKSPGIA